MSEAATTGINLSLSDGTVVKADNPEEALKTLAKMYEDTKSWAKTKIEESAQQIEAVRAEQERLAQQMQPKVPTNGFDKDRYYRLLNEDPVLANDYWFEHRFGRKPDEVAANFDAMDQRLSVFEGQTLAGQFLQQHGEDFPQTPEAAKELRTHMEDLTARGYPATLDTMNMAYNHAVMSGKIKPLEKQQQQEDFPPTPGGSGSVISDSEIAKAENMSDADLEKFLRAKGALK